LEEKFRVKAEICGKATEEVTVFVYLSNTISELKKDTGIM
jgi:hypothetical protein